MGILIGIAEARAQLEEEGARHPGRLAALLGLEHEAVAAAVKLLRGGVAEAAIEAGAADPGVAVASRAPPDAAEVLLRAGEAGAERWVAAAERAAEAGDAIVAVRWASRGRALIQRALWQRGSASSEESLEEHALRRRLSALLDERVRPTTEDLAALVDQAKALQQQGNLTGAESLLRRVLVTIEELAGTGYFDLERYEEAVERLEGTALLLGNQLDATVFLSMGSRITQRGHFPVAEWLLRKGLALSIRAGEAESIEHARGLHGLGRLLLERGKVAEAETTLREAIALKAKISGESDLSYGASVYELGRCLSAQGKYDEASTLFRRALTIFDIPDVGRNMLQAGPLHELAGIAVRRGAYAEADELYRQILDTVVKQFGPDSGPLCTPLCELASLLVLQGDLAEGGALAQRALDIAAKVYGPWHSETVKARALVDDLRRRATQRSPSSPP